MNRPAFRNVTGTFFSGRFCLTDLPALREQADLPALYAAVTYLLVFNKENPLEGRLIPRLNAPRLIVGQVS
ncbi:MAG: hypothetical protein V1681_04535 [Candidatus Neomarinimicrobiota bacterium]